MDRNLEFQRRVLRGCAEQSGHQLLESTTIAFSELWGGKLVFIGALKDRAQDIVMGFAAVRDQKHSPSFEYCSVDQPCYHMYRNERLIIPCGVQEEYARKAGSGYESFLGFPVNHPDHGCMAHFAAYDTKQSTFDSVDETTMTLIELIISREMAHLLARKKKEVIAAITEELEQWRKVALVDPLTQVGNRRSLEENWKTMLSTESKSDIGIIDIDHFKRLNDTFGHDAGDVCLKHFASELKAFFANSQTQVYRLGGEEFCVVKPLNKDSDPLRDELERFRNQFGTSFQPLGKGIPSFTFSAGVISVVDDADVYNALRKADELLYTAKEGGRNCIRCD